MLGRQPRRPDTNTNGRSALKLEKKIKLSEYRNNINTLDTSPSRAIPCAELQHADNENHSQLIGVLEGLRVLLLVDGIKPQFNHN